jgi:6-phosphogluconolactonase
MRLRYDLAGISLATVVLAGCGSGSGVSAVPAAQPGAVSAAQPGVAPALQARSAQSKPGAAAAEYVYVSNTTADNISEYSVDATSGALTQLAQSPLTTGKEPWGIAIDPKGGFLYVADYNELGSVSAYTIDASSGELTAVAGSPFATGAQPVGVAISSNGKFLYTANQNSGSGSGSVSAFTINPTSGALTPIAGSPFGAGDSPEYAVVDPKGKFIYVTNNGSNNVSAYKIASSGALTPVTGSPFATDLGPVGVTTDPLGKFVYVANGGLYDNGANDVSAYTIDKRTGALTPVVGSPFAAGSGVYSVVVDPKAGYLYASDFTSDGISGYSIAGTTGVLTALAGSPYGATAPVGEAIEPQGKFLFASDYLYEGINAYTISPSSGALTLVPGSPFSAGTNPLNVATCMVKGRTCKPPPL